MVSHIMKTTIQISDDLLLRAKRRARRQRTTLRAVVEDSLRRALAEPSSVSGFRLKKHPVAGEGRDPSLAEGGWVSIRDTIYKLG